MLVPGVCLLWLGCWSDSLFVSQAGLPGMSFVGMPRNEWFLWFVSPSVECGVGLSESFDVCCSLRIVRSLKGALSTTLQKRDRCGQKKGVLFFFRRCAVIFSSHRRSSIGDVLLSAAEPRRLRPKSKKNNVDRLHDVYVRSLAPREKRREELHHRA